jgi:hypothetical protein
MLQWPTVAQVHYIFRSLSSTATATGQVQTGPYEGLSHRPRKALRLGPNIRVNQ